MRSHPQGAKNEQAATALMYLTAGKNFGDSRYMQSLLSHSNLALRHRPALLFGDA
jgi:hypothetical protein